MSSATENDIWSELAKIPDPEIPVLTLVEMKIIRAVSMEGGKAVVVISPTFVGCPAIEQMKQDIRGRLGALGLREVEIRMTFSPPWSTDMLDESTCEKLRAYGVAPPPKAGPDLAAALAVPAPCPFCGSTDTQMQSPFGATPCKQLYVCGKCRQPFERFKPL